LFIYENTWNTDELGLCESNFPQDPWLWEIAEEQTALSLPLDQIIPQLVLDFSSSLDCLSLGVTSHKVGRMSDQRCIFCCVGAGFSDVTSN